MDEKRDVIQKLPYEKPALRTIDLASDEVLAGGCKTQTGTGDKNGNHYCVADGCFQAGS